VLHPWPAITDRADVKISHQGISTQYASKVRVWLRVKVFERVRVRVFGRVRVSFSFLTSAIVKLPKYGKTCVLLQGILCYKFVAIL